MDDSYIVTRFVLIDDLLLLMGHQDDRRTHISASEIMTVAVVAAKYFHNHHETGDALLSQTYDPYGNLYARAGYVLMFCITFTV